VKGGGWRVEFGGFKFGESDSRCHLLGFRIQDLGYRG